MILDYSKHALPEVVTGFAGGDVTPTLEEQAVTDQLDELAEDGEPPVITRRSPTKPTPQLRAEVVARYEVGESGASIAQTVGIARSTVIEIVRSADVPVRHRRLSSQECEEVAELFRAGVPQFEIALKLRLSKSHVWHVLRRAGLVGRTRPSEDLPRP